MKTPPPSLPALEAQIKALEAQRHNTRSFPRQMAIHAKIKALKITLEKLNKESV
jgi:hypothetical protein